jgi:serine/threonine protein kinase/ABC-type phosphate/phosphonate transport system substrate-binding protein
MNHPDPSSLTEVKRCASCGAEIPKDARLGHCPRCLLNLGAQPGPELEAQLEPSEIQSGRRFGDYELKRLIGRGGMGVVYEAVQISLHRPVALKMIVDSQVASPVARRRFTIEAEAAAKLDHPNIVPIYEVGEYEEHPFLSMKLIHGESLRKKILRGELRVAGPDGDPSKSKSGLRNRQITVARLMATVARAVHHAHHQGVLHRDLKPGNILVDAEGQPHLTDFGLAKLLDQAQANLLPVSYSGMVVGTPSYMSPEQAISQRLTVASDIYSLGAILYEMLTGQPPFKAGTPLETMRLVTEQEPKNPRALHRGIDADLDTICLKCLEKSPAARYNSAEALAEDLERWLRREPIQARPAGPLLRLSRWTKRNPVGAALIVTLCAGLTAALVLLHMTKERQRRLDLFQANITDGITQEIEDVWNDPNGTSIKIESGWLAALARRNPRQVPPGAVRLSFAVDINDNPIARAIRYAPFLAVIEEKMEEVLGRPVRFDLIFSKPGYLPIQALVEGKVDFGEFSGLHYLRAKNLSSGIEPVVSQDAEKEAVLFARKDAGITDLSQLVGKRVAFAHTNSIISFWAKVYLARAGITKTNLAYCQSFDATHASTAGEKNEEGADTDEGGTERFAHAEVIQRVLLGEFDAGEARRRDFERKRQHGRGLVELYTFAVAPDIITARAGLDSSVLEALRQAMVSLKSKEEKKIVARLHTYPIKGFLPISDHYLDELRSALTNEVARFDLAPPNRPIAPNSAPPPEVNPTKNAGTRGEGQRP